MKAAFADTFYYLALVNPRDAAHAKASAFSQSNSLPIVTTSWIIVELGDGLCRAENRPSFATILEILRGDPNTTIITSNEEILDRGISLFKNRTDKDWSLTDCISFEVMSEFNLSEALTGDHHFEQAGFVALLK